MAKTAAEQLAGWQATQAYHLAEVRSRAAKLLALNSGYDSQNALNVAHALQHHMDWWARATEAVLQWEDAVRGGL